MSQTFMSICYTIGSMTFLFIVLYLFLKRKGKLELENKIFLVLIILTIILVLLEFFRTYAIGDDSASKTLITFIGKTDIYLMLVWEYVFSFYLYVLTMAKQNSSKYQKHKKILGIISFVCLIITLFLVVFAPLEIYSDPVNYDAYSIGGPLIFFLYFMTITIFSFATITLTINKKSIRNIFITPLYLDFESLIIILILKLIYPYVIVNIIVPSFILTIVISYLTIESQDNRLLYDYRNAVAESEKSSKVQKAFLGNISSQIRTPMTSVIGFSDLVASNNLTEVEMKNYIDNIYKSNNEVSGLIHNLVDISKIKSNREKVTNVGYNLDKLVLKIYNHYKKVDHHGITINITADPNLPLSYIGDVEKVYKIITSIIDTAIKYDNDDTINISINGTKITDKVYEMLFTITNREDTMNEIIFNSKFDDYANENISNVDLKLIIAKELTALIGGRIDFDSQKGRNTSYYIRIRQRIQNTNPIGNLNERISLASNQIGGGKQ